MNVVILATDRQYEVGDSASLTIHVFNYGLHTDADTLDIRLNEYRANERALTASRAGTGVYQSAFTILPSDVTGTWVSVTADASVGAMVDSDFRPISIVGLSLEISTSSAKATPGQAVDVTVRVRESGFLRDADNLTLTASVFTTGGPSGTQELAWSRTGVGTYVATYAIPASIAQKTAIGFSAEATVGASDAYGWAMLLAEVPPGLIVWYHEVSVGLSSATIEVYVANETGWPVPGAAVSLTYSYRDGSSNEYTASLGGTTDDDGAASLTLSYTGASYPVSLSGTVSLDNTTQGFSGTLYLPSSTPSGFVVRQDDLLAFFAPGETANLNFTALRDGNPLPLEAIYYYVSTNEVLAANGVAYSDGAGRFSLSFPMPSGPTQVEFATKIDTTWERDYAYVYSANRLAVERGELYIGSTTHLSGSLPSTSEPWFVLGTFLPIDSPQGPLDYSWVPASGPYGLYGLFDLTVPTGTAMDYDLVVPRFLPKGQDYLLYLTAFPQSSLFFYASPDAYQYAETVRIENLPPTPVVQLSAQSLSTGGTLFVNASASTDKDGAVAEYQVDWGDGTATEWSPNATASHAYDESGEYVLEVRVRDDNGATSSTSQVIRVESLILGLESSLFVLLVVGIGLGAATVAVAVLWRRRGPPTVPAEPTHEVSQPLEAEPPVAVDENPPNEPPFPEEEGL